MRVAIAVDFDECLVEGNASASVLEDLGLKDLSEKLWKGVSDREFCRKLAAAHIGLDQKEYEFFCAFEASQADLRQGAAEFLSSAKDYAQLYIMSTGYYDVVRYKLEEAKLEANIFATKFSFADSKISGIERLVSSETKAGYVRQLCRYRVCVIAIGHHKSDEPMLTAANYSIGLLPDDAVKVNFKAEDFYQIRYVVEELVESLK